ncbi:MAG: Peroxisome biosynthesis protein pex1 [Trichoglossum hirsutum]|nr:MAG: Peroxisome biosynthesis protein pex1 [Trichoglossum hirsutum]
MAPAARKSAVQSTPAEISLVHLKSCLVNLPSSLVSVLVNANTANGHCGCQPAQNVVIELTYRQAQPFAAGSTTGSGSSQVQKSVYVGWTGMPSRRRLAPIVGKEGISGIRGSAAGREQEVPLVEIDASFGRMLELQDAQKIGVLIHVDPPLAHTINIEPLTPSDWEIIELHATFLELNLLSQIRALPNPSYVPSASANQAQKPHPLIIHLSPTSTATIIITSLTPAPPSTSPFAKISPDAEVIVAPKTRVKSSRGNGKENRSVTSAGRKSSGGRSGASTVRQRSHRDESAAKGVLFFRGVDRGICGKWFEDDAGDNALGASDGDLRVWIDRDVLASKSLRGTSCVCVSVVRPAGLQGPIELQQPQQNPEDTAGAADTNRPASKVVARISRWEDAPDGQHIALSSALCASLGADGMVGGIVRVEAAPQPLARNTVKTLKVFPFVSSTGKPAEGLKFGGGTKAEREDAGRRIQAMFGRSGDREGLLDGPLTDGLVLGKVRRGEGQNETSWEGGILRFDPPISGPTEGSKPPWGWLLGADRKLAIDVQPEIPRPSTLSKPQKTPDEPLPAQPPMMVGIDPLIGQLTNHLTHSSSVLLTGALGAGKSSLAHLLAHCLRSEYLFHTLYFPCRKLVTEETRVSTIKEILNRLFLSASWGARLGGRAIVVLDDLDRLCPVETELQVGGENGRSRQISEGVCSIVKQYCGSDTGVVLLATAQGKEALNSVVIGGHVVREIVGLKAPNKEGRRRVFEMLVNPSPISANDHIGPSDQNKDDDAAWMDASSVGSRDQRPGSPDLPNGFIIDRDLDFLDLAGQTDGYMPGDLVLLVSRARSEALIRTIEKSPDSTDMAISLSKIDFTRALKGFTPASLRNVTLQSSTTTFASIGGLYETRKILLETLQYPTTYAPIFAQCPLRLRSGLLLYGFPGCGKTLLASAVAGECGLNFISVKGPEILNKYIGASEKSVRDLFERAEAARPCVLFFDEFDSIAPKRGHDSTGVTDRVVNQLLTQMDGAEGLSGVYVLAATSRPDLIDPALLRPGRLDKSLLCDLPSFDDRLDILRALSKKLKINPQVLDDRDGQQHGTLREVARRTDGYSGADLQAVIYNAHLEAIHDLLGDNHHYEGERVNSKKHGKTSGKARRAIRSGGFNNNNDFVQFIYGEDEAVGALQSPTDRTQTLLKLDAIKAARRRRRRHSSDTQTNTHNQHKPINGSDSDDDGDTSEVTIHWAHISLSLTSTRSSISPEERGRLARIYREFVVGRNGEMPSGQGPTEVGGRSSLM